MLHNSIDSLTKYDSVMKMIESGNDNIWTSKVYKDAYSLLFVDQFTEKLNNDAMDGNRINTFELVSQVLNYLLYPLLSKQVDYWKYKIILEMYTDTATGVLSGDADYAQELSIKALFKIGYK